MLVGALCKSRGENVDHLLLHCMVASRLWRVALNWFGMQWVMLGTVKEALQSWTHRRGKRCSSIWSVTLLTIMWVIWKQRNMRAIEGVELDFVKCKVVFSL